MTVGLIDVFTYLLFISAVHNSTPYDYTSIYPVLTGDYNADGKTDIARVADSGIRIFLATSSQSSSLTFREAPIFARLAPGAGYTNDGIYPFLAGDWNGDGLFDIARATPSSVLLANHLPITASRLLGITDGVGKVININYTPLTDANVYTKYSGSQYPQADISIPINVVKYFSVSNGIGGIRESEYKYKGLRYNSSHRASFGFERVESIDVETSVKTTTLYRQDFPYVGMAYQQLVNLANGTLVSRKEDDWGSLMLGSGSQQRNFVYAGETREKKYELDGSLITFVTATNTYDNNGNLNSTLKTYNDGATELSTFTYDNNYTDWLIGQVREATVRKIGSTTSAIPITRKTNFSYYPTTGLLEYEILEPGTPFALTKRRTYYFYGNILTERVTGADILPEETTYTYDPKGQFKITSTNALNHRALAEYDLKNRKSKKGT